MHVYVKFKIENNTSASIEWVDNEIEANSSDTFTVDFDELTQSQIQELDNLNSKSNVTVTFLDTNLVPDGLDIEEEIFKLAFNKKRDRVKRRLSTDVGSESSNTISVDAQIIDGDSEKVEDPFELRVDVVDQDLNRVADADFGVTVTGNGSSLSNSNQASLLLETGTNGDTQVSVEDKSTTSTATLFVRFTILSEGIQNYTQITFS